MYLLHKRLQLLSNVSGRLFISNCGAPTEKVSKLLGSHMEPIMRRGWSYIKDSQDLINKSSKLTKRSDNVILVTTDVVGLYPSILHNVGLRALKEALDTREQNKFLHRTSCKRQSLFWKIFFLSLIVKSNSKTLRLL